MLNNRLKDKSDQINKLHTLIDQQQQLLELAVREEGQLNKLKWWRFDR